MRWWWSRPREKLYYHTEWAEYTLDDINQKLDALREKLLKLRENHK